MYSVIVIIKKKEKKNRRETENISLELTWPTKNRTQAQIVQPVDKQCPIHTATVTKGPSGTVHFRPYGLRNKQAHHPSSWYLTPARTPQTRTRVLSVLNSRRFAIKKKISPFHPQHLLRRPPHRDPDSGAARRCSDEPTSLPG